MTTFFHADSEIPEGGTQYSGYSGAMKCMMTGHGDVALVKDTAYRLYCDENEDGMADGPDWCLERDEIVMLPSFGQAPSHPVMYDPARMDDETMLVIQEALLALDDDSEGREILNDVLNTAGMVASTGEEHRCTRTLFQMSGIAYSRKVGARYEKLGDNLSTGGGLPVCWMSFRLMSTFGQSQRVGIAQLI